MSGLFQVTPGETLNIGVDLGGGASGGHGAGKGGGASYVDEADATGSSGGKGEMVLVAGGGGGGGYYGGGGGTLNARGGGGSDYAEAGVKAKFGRTGTDDPEVVITLVKG